MTIHPVVALTRRSQFSTLKDGAPDAALPHKLGKENKVPITPRNTHTNAPAHAPPPKDRARVPTTALTPSPGRHTVWPKGMVVWFNPAVYKHMKDYGVRFMDVKHGNMSDMYDPHECVLATVPQTQAELRILWPGYVHLDRRFRIVTRGPGGPATRWDIARQVVDCYDRFLQDARRAQCAPGNQGWDVNRVNFEDLVLVSFSNSQGHDAVFQANVEIA